MTHTDHMPRRASRATLATALSTMLVVSACSKQTEDTAQTEVSQTDTTAQVAASSNSASNHRVEAATQASVDRLIVSYANMAQAAYEDSLASAKQLQAAVATYVETPTPANLDAAKAAYKVARQPYSQTEVFRFDDGFVGQDEARRVGSVDGWEGQVNAWPLDEALIDYVSDDYAGAYDAKDNIINSDLIRVGGETTPTDKLTPARLAAMNEIGGSEANVTTGYHAIEFLLWGQDTNGTGAGAGMRPVSDYMTDERCTSGVDHPAPAAVCKKRADYLTAATQLLVDDLSEMVAQWQPNREHTLRQDLMNRKDSNALRQIMYQMGSLALGELASERMQVAFVTGSTEDEHECFSDLTHLSYANNARGIDNVFNGRYTTLSGDSVGGYGLKNYLIDTGNQEIADTLAAQFGVVDDSFAVIVDKGENEGIKVDQMIATAGQASKHGISAETQNSRRGLIEAAITGLQALTDGIETAANAVGIDSLDADTGSQF